MFNGSKSHLLLFKGRNCKILTRGVTVNGVSLNVSKTAVHLGPNILTKDKECTLMQPQIVLGDLLICSYLIMVISIPFLNELFGQYYCSYYGSLLWPLQTDRVECLEKVTGINWWSHPQTQCDVIAALSCQKPLILSLRARVVKYFNNCLANDNNVVTSVAFSCNVLCR